jgi:hypothetical protein
MSDTPGDVFGRIDALLGRRVGFAPGEEPLVADDFPVLTDVVAREVPGGPLPGAGQDEAGLAAGAADLSTDASASGEPPVDLPNLGIIPPAYDLDLLAELPPDPLEVRLAELAAHQQAQLEAMIRRVVREELERYLGGQSSGPTPL